MASGIYDFLSWKFLRDLVAYFQQRDIGYLFLAT
jgi:hypothetical protein